MQYNSAIVLLTSGVFGGAERRFTQLVEYLSYHYPGKYYFIITWDLYHKILEVFSNFPIQYLIPVGVKTITVKNNREVISRIKNIYNQSSGFYQTNL